MKKLTKTVIVIIVLSLTLVMPYGSRTEWCLGAWSKDDQWILPERYYLITVYRSTFIYTSTPLLLAHTLRFYFLFANVTPYQYCLSLLPLERGFLAQDFLEELLLLQPQSVPVQLLLLLDIWAVGTVHPPYGSCKSSVFIYITMSMANSEIRWQFSVM